MRRGPSSVWLMAVLAWGCGAVDAAGPDPVDEPPGTYVEAACMDVTLVSLDPGEVAMLPPRDSTCLSFAVPGRYVAAFLDVSAIESARGETPLNSFRDDVFTANVALRLQGQGTTTAGLVVAQPDTRPSHDVIRLSQVECEQADPVWCRDRPWTPGEDFDAASEGELRTAVVVAVDGPLVLAIWKDEMDVMAPALGTLRAAVGEAKEEVIPLLRETFVDEMVTTSPQSGQLLIIAYPGSVSTADWRPSETLTSSRINLSISPAMPEELLRVVAVSVLAHELAHAWQFRYYGHGTGNVGDLYLPPWGIEGGATFLEQEYLRLRFGIPLDANRPASPTAAVVDPEDLYWNNVHVARGAFEEGYHQAEPMLRHFRTRLLDAGMSERASLAEVARGAIEGWYGNTGTQWRPPGITGRMQVLLGAGWDAVDGILDWTISQALDDRAPGEYRNPLVRDAWDQVSGSGFPPVTHLQIAPVVIQRTAGSTGYVEFLVTDDPHIRLTVGAPTGEYGPPGIPPGQYPLAPVLRWMIARIR